MKKILYIFIATLALGMTAGCNYLDQEPDDLITEEMVFNDVVKTTVLLQHPRVCGFCYTQLYDVEQEVNGLMTYDREVDKLRMDVVQELNRKLYEQFEDMTN